MRDILIVIEAILAVIIMISILVQPSKSDALSGFVPGNGDTFFAKNKGRTKEARLVKLTIVTSILFASNGNQTGSNTVLCNEDPGYDFTPYRTGSDNKFKHAGSVINEILYKT